jgi:molybdate transport system ATP-binding protein
MEYLSVAAAQQCVLETVAALGAEPVKLEQSPGRVLADHLVLIEQGCVIASGALNETLSRLDLPTAHLNDAGAVIEARVALHDQTYHLTRLDFTGGNLWVSKVEIAVGSVVRARVLARDVSIAITAPHGSSITNILAARIAGIQDGGRIA